MAAALTVLIFAIAYDGFNNLATRGAAADGKVLDLCFWDALLYSGATFFTASIAEIEPIDRLGRALTVAESGLGIALIALLIFTLGNRISRS